MPNATKSQNAPGIYRGGSSTEFGLWRLRPDGVWLFSMPVEGSEWKIATIQTGEGMILLADETSATEHHSDGTETLQIKSRDLRPGDIFQIDGRVVLSVDDHGNGYVSIHYQREGIRARYSSRADRASTVRRARSRPQR